MRFLLMDSEFAGIVSRTVQIDRGDGSFSSFPAEIGNPNYDSFLESQGLTDAEVQAMEPDVWHDLSAI